MSLAGFEPTETRSRLRDLAFGFHVEHAARVGKPRWVEKTAFDAFHVDDIDRLVGGHVRYVIITRHGLDCAVSMDELCRKNGIASIAGGCPLMFGPTADGGHRFMKTMLGLFGQLPKDA